MSLQIVKLESLMPSKENPRKSFDDDALNGLAISLKQDGVLQNLVVIPMKGKGGRYRIISGERRYRALKMLAERGEIANDFAVPVEIRAKLSKDDTARIATVENVQRQNLAPLEEAEAFAKLIQNGVSLGDVMAQTGLGRKTIKRCLSLNGLCAEAKTALADNRLSLACVETLTLVRHSQTNGWNRQITGFPNPCSFRLSIPMAPKRKRLNAATDRLRVFPRADDLSFLADIQARP